MDGCFSEPKWMNQAAIDELKAAIDE